MFGEVVNKAGFENPGYMHGISCISIVESKYKGGDDDGGGGGGGGNKIEGNGSNAYSSSSTSSIGKNSDVSGNSVDNSEDTEEVQSSYKGPFDAMEALEEVLPIRKGISRFYKGKSKSFASLADTAASVKDLAKPENAYARRRRNLLAYSMSWEKNRNIPLRSNNGGISKRVTSSSRTTLALAVAMNSTTNDASDSLNIDYENVSKPAAQVSRFHPQFKLVHGAGSSSPRGSFSPWRSFSLADLQQCEPSTTSDATTTLIEAKPS